MRSLESLIEEANLRGYQINNLFERGDGYWQANLRDDKNTQEFGHGKTPGTALEAALEKCNVIVKSTDPFS